MILIIHTIASVFALLAGAIVFFVPKGTASHKKIGYTYVVNMIVLLITSFWIFDLFGSFGVYHALSIVSFLTLAVALYFPLFGRSRTTWIRNHLLWMGYSDIGLVMAGGSHLFTVFPQWPAGVRMILFWGVPYLVGSALIFRYRTAAADAAKANMNS